MSRYFNIKRPKKTIVRPIKNYFEFLNFANGDGERPHMTKIVERALKRLQMT